MPPVKIFIDSAFRRDGSFSNFNFQLPRPFDVQKQYKAMVDQIHIPHTFPTITANNNRALYLDEEYADPANPPARIQRQPVALAMCARASYGAHGAPHASENARRLRRRERAMSTDVTALFNRLDTDGL